jgi:hypothetical protein
MEKDELKQKIIMYIAYHYGSTWASEKELLDAIEKDGWFDMSIDELFFCNYYKKTSACR